MKKLYLLIFSILTLAISAQQNTIIIPVQFDFQKQASQYQLNELTEFLFKKQGFSTLWENQLSDDIAKNPCQAYKAEVLDESNMFTTKLKIRLKDCKGKEIFLSEQGTSRSKEYKTAYHEALREAFEKGKQQLSQIKMVKTTNSQNEQIIQNKIDEPINSSKNPPTTEQLYAQPLSKGIYQLVDKSPKIILKIYKTSIENVYIAQSEHHQGIFYKKDNSYIFEYYENDISYKKEYLVTLE